jgi:hypothetical protein
MQKIETARSRRWFQFAIGTTTGMHTSPNVLLALTPSIPLMNVTFHRRFGTLIYIYGTKDYFHGISSQ